MDTASKTIRQALPTTGISPGLAHALLRNSTSPLLAMPVEEFIRQRPHLINRSIRYRGFPQPIIKEIVQIIEARFASVARSSLNPKHTPTPRIAGYEALFAIMEAIAFPSVVMQIPLSARLHRLMLDFERARDDAGGDAEDTAWQSWFRTVADIVKCWPSVTEQALQLDNVGARSITELKRILESILTDSLRNACLRDNVRIDDLEIDISGLSTGTIQLNRRLMSWLDRIGTKEATSRVLAALDRGVKAPIAIGAGSRRGRVPTELPGLPGVFAPGERECEILARRFGMGRPPESLETIGESFRLTRERVRQLQAKAIEHISQDVVIERLQAIIEENKARIVSSLTAGTGFLSYSDAREINRDRAIELGLDGSHCLAIEIVHRTLQDWFGHIGAEIPDGWLLGEAAARRDWLLEIRNVIKEMLDQSRVSISTAKVISRCTAGMPGTSMIDLAQDLEIAAKMIPGCAIYGSRIVNGSGPMTRRRGAVLHGLAVDIAQGSLFDITSLCDAYAATNPEDYWMPNRILRNVQEMKNGFWPVLDRLWFPLHERLPEFGSGDRLPFDYTPDMSENSPWRRKFGPDTAARLLSNHIRSRGAMRITDIDQQKVGANYRDKMKNLNSIIRDHPNFIYLSPALYGVIETVESICSPDTDIPGEAMSGRALLAFTLNKEVGGPENMFPLWGPKFERHLAGWARDHATKDQFSRLMAVAEPELWPGMDSLEGEFWIQIRDEAPKVRHEQPQLRVHSLPQADKLVSCMIYTWWRGRISWFEASRIAGYMSHVDWALPLLGTLCALGLVEPGMTWDAPHNALPALGDALVNIMQSIRSSGEADWSADTFRNLAAIMVSDAGWAEQTGIRPLLRRAGETSLARIA